MGIRVRHETIVMSTQDGTDAELLLEQFANQSPDVFWMYSADWETLHFVNDSYEEVFGQCVDELRADPTSFVVPLAYSA
jgi:hypothetical protein